MGRWVLNSDTIPINFPGKGLSTQVNSITEYASVRSPNSTGTSSTSESLIGPMDSKAKLGTQFVIVN